MKNYSLSHMSDQTLLDGLAALVTRDRCTTAEMLAHIAEVDARKLYLPAAYPSMYAYCVGKLKLSEDAAAKRIQAARVARRFPVIFQAVADGRLHLTGVGLLAPHLTESTAEDLLTAAMGRTKAGIEQLLAERFPQPDMLAWVAETAGSSGAAHPCQHAPAHVDERVILSSASGSPSPGLAGSRPVCERSTIKPLAPQRFGVQFTLSQEGHDMLRRAQDLLGHQVPSGDIAEVVERALELLVGHLEQQKFAATCKPRPGRHRSSGNPRHIPAHVKRAVWARDQGRCTFVSETGHRCEARRQLEFDHALEVARGGEASLPDVRLRCRAHNQYTAECTFGPEFMRHKRVASAETRTSESASPTQRAPGSA